MSKRLHFIDVLRGLAACAVLLQHLFEVRSAGFNFVSLNYFQSGVFGVSLFFVISGFIIPYTLEKSPSLAIFWLRRLLRLYPLYLFCLLVLVAIGVFHGEHYSLLRLVLNLLMINEPASIRIIGLSWTLTFELIFYLILSGLFILRWHKYSLLNCLVLLTVAVVLAVLKHSYGAVVLVYFILFFSGNVFHQLFRNELPRKFFYPLFGGLLLFIAIINFYGLSQVSDSALGSRSFLPRTSANLLALLTFFAAIGLRKKGVMQNKALFWLGEISYSVYLMQVVTLLLFNSWWAILAATFGLALATHYLIERPFIRYSYHLSAKLIGQGTQS